ACDCGRPLYGAASVAGPLWSPFMWQRPLGLPFSMTFVVALYVAKTSGAAS
ncbi:hypothetical protein A2U01_0023803, partial [Trifolium medium]|nr:hypothetical protein [Trifolium medium]